jgi:anthranilate/para-aminobenzoate synthase component II
MADDVARSPVEGVQFRPESVLTPERPSCSGPCFIDHRAL